MTIQKRLAFLKMKDEDIKMSNFEMYEKLGIEARPKSDFI